MDKDPLLVKVEALPKDWTGSVTDFAAVVGVARSTVYAWERRDLVRPDLTRGNRRFYTKQTVLDFVRQWIGGAA